MSTALKNIFSVLEAKNTPITAKPNKKSSWSDHVEDEVPEGFTKVESDKGTSSSVHFATAENISNAKKEPTAADFETARRLLPRNVKGEIVPGSEYANPLDVLKKNKVTGSGSGSKRRGRKKAHKKAAVFADSVSASSWKEKEARIAALAWSGPAAQK